MEAHTLPPALGRRDVDLSVYGAISSALVRFSALGLALESRSRAPSTVPFCNELSVAAVLLQ